VTKDARIRWKTVGLCLMAAVAWDYLYIQASIYLDPDHRFALWLAEAPRWVRRIHLWTPDLLATRVLNAFGFRFDKQHYDDNTLFVCVSTALAWLIWTAVLYGVVTAVRRWRKPASQVAAA
jgi:hypothetical protein